MLSIFRMIDIAILVLTLCLVAPQIVKLNEEFRNQKRFQIQNYPEDERAGFWKCFKAALIVSSR